MVRGLENFRNWFRGYESNYAIIGGTACYLLFSQEGADFRTTKDIDMVLIVEALSADFGSRFWEYVKLAGYEHRGKSTGAPEFYRFTAPQSPEYPAMIELFSRRLEGITLPAEAVLTPYPVEEDVSSMSAILLDDEYYGFLKTGVVRIDGVPVLDAAHLIPFKAKAWLDLTRRRENGSQVDSKNIRKHKNDVYRLSTLLNPDLRLTLPAAMQEVLREFLAGTGGETDKAARITAAYGLPLHEDKA